MAENPDRSNVRGLRPSKFLDTWKHCVLENTVKYRSGFAEGGSGICISRGI